MPNCILQCLLNGVTCEKSLLCISTFSTDTEHTNTTFQKQTVFVFGWTTILRGSNNLKEPKIYKFISNRQNNAKSLVACIRIYRFLVLLDCWLILMTVVHLKTKAVCLWNVVFVQSVTMGKVQIHISDVSHLCLDLATSLLPWDVNKHFVGICSFHLCILRLPYYHSSFNGPNECYIKRYKV
jgi:hypothetical protein